MRTATRTPGHTALIGVVLAVVLTACTGWSREGVVGPATLDLAGSRIELEVTSCALVGGRLLEELPPGGAQVAVVAEGQDDAGRPVHVTARRGTDVVAPHRFELLEISLGEVSDQLEVLVVLRGFDRATASWTQVDPDAADARRPVAAGLFEIDGPRLTARGTTTRAPDGRRVRVAFEAVCPPQLERDPGLA